MSLLFLDSFGYADAGSHSDVTAGDDLKLNWSAYGTVTITELATGTNGRRCYITGDTNDNVTPDITLDEDTLVIGWRHYRGADTGHTVWALNRDAVRVGTIAITHQGEILYHTDPLGDFTDEAEHIYRSNFRLPVGVWTYVEVKMTFDPSTGSVEMWFNGVSDGSAVTGADTENTAGPVNLVKFMTNETAQADWIASTAMADIYIDNANQHGPMEIWYQEADGAGSNADWTPSAGSNHQNVDEIGPDGDTTYNSSATPGDQDTFVTSKAADTGSTVVAAQALALVRSEAGTQNFRVGMIADPGGTPTESWGSDVGISSADYIGARGPIEEVDPDTASGWTVSNVNAAEMGYELRS